MLVVIWNFLDSNQHFLFINLRVLEGEAYQKANVGSRSEKGELWVIRSRSEIMRTIREMLNRARISINVVTTANGLILFYKATNKLLDKLVDEGVAIKVETNIGSLNGSLAKELNYICEVKNANVPSSMLFLCVDRQEIIVSQLKPDDFNTESDEDVGFFSRNPTLCALVSQLLSIPTRHTFSSNGKAKTV